MPPAPPPDRPNEPFYCNTFTEFVERVALPRLLENPRATRLDGQDSGGNRKVAGRFFFAGRQWKVHSDTHSEPVPLGWRDCPIGADWQRRLSARTWSSQVLDLCKRATVSGRAPDLDRQCTAPPSARIRRAHHRVGHEPLRARIEDRILP